MNDRLESQQRPNRPLLVMMLWFVFGLPSVEMVGLKSRTGPLALFSQEEIITLRGPLVTLGVRATDNKGREVHGLKAEDFSILENGTRQPISFFSEEEQPLSLEILLDKSHSMSERGKLIRAKLAALSVVRSISTESEYLYIAFDNEVRAPNEFTKDRERVQAAIYRTVSEGGGTSLYDAILVGLDRLARARHPRQALVVITDGADQHSEHRLDEVIRRVQASQAQLFLIGYFSQAEDEIFRRTGEAVRLVGGQEIDNPRFVFKRLAEESGAAYYFPTADEELIRAVEAISNDLRHQYTIAYYPPNPKTDGRYRKIEVKVNRRALKVRARAGYVTSPNAGTSTVVSAGDSSTPSKTTASAPIRTRAKPYESKLERTDGRLTYRDDFSDATSGWPHTTGAFYERGGYHLRDAGIPIINGPDFRDFRASVQVELRSGPTVQGEFPSVVVRASPGVGLVFRLNPNGYYAFLIGAPQGAGQGQFKLIKQVGGRWVEIIPWTTAPRLFPRNNLTVVCRGSRIELYINSGLVSAIMDETFREGGVGLLLSEKGHAVFDDLIVEQL